MKINIRFVAVSVFVLAAGAVFGFKHISASPNSGSFSETTEDNLIRASRFQ